jgi:hypothetical protein
MLATSPRPLHSTCLLTLLLFLLLPLLQILPPLLLLITLCCCLRCCYCCSALDALLSAEGGWEGRAAATGVDKRFYFFSKMLQKFQ